MGEGIKKFQKLNHEVSGFPPTFWFYSRANYFHCFAYLCHWREWRQISRCLRAFFALVGCCCADEAWARRSKWQDRKTWYILFLIHLDTLTLRKSERTKCSCAQSGHSTLDGWIYDLGSEFPRRRRLENVSEQTIPLHQSTKTRSVWSKTNLHSM